MIAGDTPTSPLAQTGRPLYEASTQFRNWRYSQEQLSELRTSLNGAAVAGIRHTFDAQEVCS